MTCPQCALAEKPTGNKVYLPQGNFRSSESGNVNFYQRGSGSNGVLVITDLFGWNEHNKNIFRWCDMLADEGYNVICVDFFHGKPFDIHKFPPINPLDFCRLLYWLKYDNPATEQVRRDFYDEILPLWGVERMGVLGMCWGAGKAFELATDGRFQCAVAFHSGSESMKSVSRIKCPVLYCPSSWDPAPAKIRPVLDKKSFASLNVYRHFDDQSHGWTVRNNPDDAETGDAIEEAMVLARAFLKSMLVEKRYEVSEYVEEEDDGLKFYEAQALRGKYYKYLTMGVLFAGGCLMYAQKTGRVDVRKFVNEKFGVRL